MGPCEVIVEIGNTHEGSLGVAKSFVLMAKKSGARTVKFQMHLAEFEGVKQEPFRVKFSDQDKSRQDYWKRVNFTVEEWLNLHDYCRSLDMEFLCTPFSLRAAEILLEYKLVKRWKIGSGQAVEWPLIDFVSKSGLPLIISTGLVNDEELLILRERLKSNASWGRTTLLHCVSQYPAPIEHLDLHLIDNLKHLGCPVGYSDHSGSIYPPLYAISLDASVVEVHMTPRKDYFGPDVSSSLLPEEVALLVEYSSMHHTLSKSAGTKLDHFERVKDLRKIFRKGVYWNENLEKGSIVEIRHLKFLKPVISIDVTNFESLIGKTVGKSVSAGEPVKPGDLIG